MNPVIDAKTGAREYSEGLLIPTTAKEDRKAEAGAKSELKKDYNVLGSNCAVTVQNALDGAGKKDGSPSLLSNAAAAAGGALVGGPAGAAAAVTANEKTPRLIYERIKDQNNGQVVRP